MTVRRVDGKIEYDALSTDDWPAGSEGSTLHVIDTGEQYIFHDGGWEPDLHLITAIRAAFDA